MTIYTVVKGNPMSAVLAAVSRGFRVQSIDPSARYNECALRLIPYTCDMDDMLAWFSEPSACAPGSGFPIGTCLYYRELE